MRQLPRAPHRVFLNHGAPAALDGLRQRISRELGWSVSAATEGVEWAAEEAWDAIVHFWEGNGHVTQR